MTVPALTLTTESAADVSADVLVIGVRSGRNGASILGVGDEFAAIQDELAAIGFSGGKDDLRRIPASVGSARAIALVGLGSDEPNAATLRYAAGTATRLLRGVESIALALPVDGEDTVLAERATAVATAIHTVRDLVNTPPSDLYPETFADAAATLSTDLPLELTVLDERELEAGGFGGLIGVGQGSTRGPRLVKVSYSPAD